MRKKRDVIAGRALVIDRSYVHSVLASGVGTALSGISIAANYDFSAGLWTCSLVCV